MDHQHYTRPSAASKERQVHGVQSSPPPTRTFTLNVRVPKILKRKFWRPLAAPLRTLWARLTLLTVLIVLLLVQVFTILEPHLVSHTYAMGQGEHLLQAKDSFLAGKLKLDTQTGSYNYNADFRATNLTTDTTSGGPQIKAIASQDPAKGLKVTDPLSNTELDITPQFSTLSGKQDGNRIVYPLMDGTGWMVYTMQASGVKEDTILRHAGGDSTKLRYKLGLDSQGLAAHIEKDGSVGIYGSSLPITGNVSTGNAKDAALLAKVRKNTKKDKLLFELPAPVVYEMGHIASKTVHTHYELKGAYLTTVTTGLKSKGTTYPLDVDPAVTVIGTSDLFRDTNPDSDVDFNATTGNISRGTVTGGLLPAWTTNSNNLANPRFLQGAAIFDDYLYVAGGAGAGATTPLTSIEFARVNKTNATIGSWSSTTSLPVGLSRFRMLAYNGYMYVVGGATGTTDCTTVSSAIYYNRIQTNGQLSSTWTTTTSLPAGVCGLGATVYKNKLYIAGGQTNNQYTSVVATTDYASINPNGSLGAFSGTGVALPAATSGGDLQAYNDYLYYIGGITSGGTGSTQTTASYIPLNTSGVPYGTAWKSTSQFTTGRANLGSSFSFAYDGYMYLEGGCNSFNASFTCASGSMLGDTQIAQINADGTLGPWSTDSQAAVTALTGASLLSWRGTAYHLAGCNSMSTASVSCPAGNVLATQAYSAISTSGQVGPLNTSANTFTTARYAHAAAVVNGYMYIMGGCITVDPTNGCQLAASGTANTTSTTYYAALNSNGSLGTFTLDSHTGFNTTNGGLAGMGVAVYNNYIYLIGGYDYTNGAEQTVYYAQPSSTGPLAAAWATTTTIAAAAYGMSSFAYNGYVYSIGGCSSAAHFFGCGSYLTTVQRAAINSNGTLGTWSTTGLSQLSTGQALAGGAVYNGYVYVAGGQTATVQQNNGIQYAAISASGIGTWTSTTGGLTPAGTAARQVDAYAMNGYLYVTGGYSNASGIVGKIQMGKISMSTGDIASMAPAMTTITPRWDARDVFANGYLYATGGCTAGSAPTGCTAASTLTEYVEIYNAGNKNGGTWSAGNADLSTPLMGTSAAVSNGTIYMAGGCQSFVVPPESCNSGNFQSVTEYNTLNPDGSMGTWNSGTGLPNARYASCSVVIGGLFYVIGGFDSNGNATTSVYSAPITSGIGTWTTGTTLPSAYAEGGCATYNGRIYLTGGISAQQSQSGTVSRTVLVSPDVSAGRSTSAWQSLTGFTTARYQHQSVIAGGYLYVVGGFDGSSCIRSVQYVQLDPTAGGEIGSWASATDLPQKNCHPYAFAANGYVTVVGGRAAAIYGATWTASVNSTGTLSQWSQSPGSSALNIPREYMAGVYYSGYYYVLGGVTDTVGTIASTANYQMEYHGAQVQAQIASFSKYADLNGDGNPQKLVIYLTNAQLNSVDIEKWKMTYISSRMAANAWGQSTTINPLVNQSVNIVHAYDGTGTDQKIARWYYLTFSIDMTTSFTFTDDVQPTIYHYGLHYSPPPSKRLIHGQDFRDQTHQGLDLKL